MSSYLGNAGLDERQQPLSQQIGNGGLQADQTAELLHLSKRKLARQLSKLGTSISTELSQAKMDYAKDALKYSDRSVEEIACALGYSDPSNFARAFAKEENLKPSEFRLRHQQRSKPNLK